MKNKKNYSHHIWYTRCGDEVKGPFPIGMIRRFVLLGRLRARDEVSPDKEEWHYVKDVPEVVPDEVREANTEEGQMRLKLARLHEDERGLERRDRESGRDILPYLGRHIPEEEQRSTEMEQVLEHHVQINRMERQEENKQDRKSNWRSLSVVVLFLIGLVVAGFYARKSGSPSIVVQTQVQCSAIPAPGVNWSNCKLEGLLADGANLASGQLDNADLHGASLNAAILTDANLSYAMLSNADLRFSQLVNARLVGTSLRNANLGNANLSGADLSYANLQNAILAGAQLDNARLGKAIWVDGSVCAPGSVGECLLTR